MVCIYISAFLITPSTAHNSKTLLPASWNENKVIFGLFWLGFYKQNGNSSVESMDIEEMSGSSYFAPYWPYFVLLFILILEKVS